MLIIGMGILFLFGGALSATIINIPNDYPTIQQGIDVAIQGDTVLVQPGLYQENIVIDKAILVASLYLMTADSLYINTTILDGNNVSTVVEIMTGFQEAKLVGFSIQNGADSGISCGWSSCLISNCKIHDNFSPTAGGAITFYDLVDYITIENVEIYNNYSVIGGGGIFYSVDCEGAFNLVNTKIFNNEAENGGGLCISKNSSFNYDISLNNCSFIDNYASENGGGLFCNGSDVNLYDCQFINCWAWGSGGAIYGQRSDQQYENPIIYTDKLFTKENYCGEIEGCNIYLSSCNLACINSALIGGEEFFEGYAVGTDYQSSDVQIIMINCLIHSYCYAIINYHGSTTIINATIAENIVDPSYCDPIVYSDTLNVINSIIWNEWAQELQGNHLDVSYSDIQNYNGIGLNNINLDPVFVDANNLDLRLSENSPCINTGTPDTTGLHLSPWDLDGNPRIYDGRIDMGAYEWQGVAVDDTVQICTISTLHQNFPNPFSTSTKISFSLPHPEKVKIQIYNLKGQLVETLLDEQKPAGNHSIVWEPDEMSSGIYFCKLATNKISSVQKLVIIQ